MAHCSFWITSPVCLEAIEDGNQNAFTVFGRYVDRLPRSYRGRKQHLLEVPERILLQFASKL